jgi:TonB family protein
MTRQQEFRHGDFVRRRASLATALAACLLTFALLGLAPPSAAPDRPAVDARSTPTFVALTDEIVLPVPPEPVHRSRAVDPEPEAWVEEIARAPEPDSPRPESIGPPLPAAVAPGEEFVVFDEPPHPRRMAVAEYPEIAREAGVEGWVLCAIRIDVRGLVTEVRILDGSSEMFHDAARAALLRSTFSPALQSGRPVACLVVQRVEFRLE